jgi:two-component system sensor histidine kinase PilS (NtrC family)
MTGHGKEVMQSMFDDRQWLAWLVKVRVVILTFLLGIELAIAQFTPTLLPVWLFIGTILLWYGISFCYFLLVSFWKDYRSQALLQVVIDLILVTLVVYITGGVDSSLNVLYPLVLIVAAIQLPRSWAYLSAALAFILYGAVLELTYFEVVPSYSGTHPGLGALQAIILINLFAYLAVAYLTGLLASKLRQVDVKLKYTSEVLEDLQVLHENIVQAINSGLMTTGLDGHITLANLAAQRLLERSEGELKGQSINKLFLDPLPQVGDESAHGEVRFTAPNMYRKTFRVVVTPLTLSEGGMVGYVYTLDDLTELRRLEREVRMQDRLAAVGRLAAAIAHEIRNPLTSIAGSVSMLSEVPNLGDEHRHLLEIVTRESDRLNSIITDFLAYSRGRQYQFNKVDLVPLLNDTLTLLEHRLRAEDSGIQIVKDYRNSVAHVLADGDRLKQVFWNFCENAVRAMRKGGKLTVTLQALGDEWQVEFGDTGPGMTPQVSEKIFEPFQSNFEGGTGLGLAIVYQIVQAHEGTVWARSKPGEGSVFVLRLRRCGAEAVAPAAGRDLRSALAASDQAASAVAGGATHG